MTQREVWKVILFGIITLGIYDLVWLYKTRNELVAKGAAVPKFKILFIPYLIIIVVGLLCLIVFSLPSNVLSHSDSSPETLFLSIMAIIIVLASLACLPISLWWFYHYSKAVEKVTGGKTSFGLAFGLAIILSIVNVGFVWPGVIQDGFNKASDDGAVAGGPQPTTNPEPPYPPVQPAATPPSQPAV